MCSVHGLYVRNISFKLLGLKLSGLRLIYKIFLKLPAFLLYVNILIFLKLLAYDFNTMIVQMIIQMIETKC